LPLRGGRALLAGGAVAVAGWLPPDAADAMPPTVLSASTINKVLRSRWRLRGGFGASVPGSGPVRWVVSDMVIPYSMVSRAIISMRWLGPRGPHGVSPFTWACPGRLRTNVAFRVQTRTIDWSQGRAA
jgi:hypothetical protein